MRRQSALTIAWEYDLVADDNEDADNETFSGGVIVWETRYQISDENPPLKSFKLPREVKEHLI